MLALTIVRRDARFGALLVLAKVIVSFMLSSHYLVPRC